MFVSAESLTLFELIGQQPGDLRRWLHLLVAEREYDAGYMDFFDYVKAKSVVNDPAECALGLIKPLVKKFKKESNLHEAMIVTKQAMSAWSVTRSKTGSV